MRHLVRQAALTLLFLSSSCSEKMPLAKLLNECWPDLKDGEVNAVEAVAWYRGGEIALSRVCSGEGARVTYSHVEDADRIYKILKRHMAGQGEDLAAFRLSGRIHIKPDGNGISIILNDVQSFEILTTDKGDDLVRKFRTLVADVTHSKKKYR